MRAPPGAIGREDPRRVGLGSRTVMLHHISLPVSDLERSVRLYDAALSALGYRRVCTEADFVGYGVEEGEDKLALKHVRPSATAGIGFHLALSAPSREAVDRFHRAALAHGAKDNGAPGMRPHYGSGYYAAFIVDLDGHRIEAVINDRAAEAP
jgi:catechol 2,3-dioxygenase-like lactoylglutathione lyase family enzyme